MMSLKNWAGKNQGKSIMGISNVPVPMTPRQGDEVIKFLELIAKRLVGIEQSLDAILSFKREEAEYRTASTGWQSAKSDQRPA